MPKKRKNGQSPARAPGQQNDSWSNMDNRVYGAREPCLHGESNRSNSAYGLPNSSAVGFTDREHVMRNMEEVFSHLDPEVIHMVLTECDFNMENAMDSLLELSDAAKGVPSLPPPVSGFEFAAALLKPDIPPPVPSYAKATGSRPQAVHTPHTLTHSTQPEPSPLAASVPLSSLPTPQPPAWQALKGNPSVESGQHQTSSPKPRQDSRGNSPVGELSFAGGGASADRSDRLDFSHLIGGSVGLGGSGSAFQAYRRDEQQPRAVGGAWNITAPEFHPRSEGPSFITPVALNPNLAARLSTYGSVSQAPLKPTATIPTSWAVQQPPIHGNKPATAPTFNQRLRFEGRVLVLLRGAPGSGKSSLARAMLDHNPGGVSLSTDGYFCRQGEYRYNPSELSTAHEWNQQRAKEAMERGQGIVIIDNTNMQSWEMRPYVAMALKLKYKVVFREPDTWWKFKPRELEKHTKHGVTREKIRRMLDGFDRHVSVHSIMGSRRPDLHTELPVTSDLPRPDLLGPPPPVSLPDVSSMPVGLGVFVGQPPELLDCVDLYQDPQEVEEQLQAVEPPVLFSQSNAQRERPVEPPVLFSSQSIAQRPVEPPVLFSSQSIAQRPVEPPVLFAQSNAQRERPVEPPVLFSQSTAQRERSVEPPVLFSSQSIAQRERRSRERARHPGGPQPDEQQSSTAPTQASVEESSGPGDNREVLATGSAAGVHGETGEGAQRARLAFVGDWPCESQEPQDQRASNRRRAEKEAALGQGDGVGGCTEGKRSGGGPDFTEFHKLLDLLQGDTEAGGQIEQLLSDSEEEEEESSSSSSSSSGPDTQPGSPSSLTEDSTHVPVSSREKDTDGEEDSGEESSKEEEEEMNKDREREGEGRKESKAGKESEGRGEEGGEDRGENRGEEGGEDRGEEREGADSFHVSEKRRLSRRAVKPCRLALTFTKQAPPPSVSPHHLQPESPPQPERHTQDVSTETVSSRGISTQTESCDLALLWRMEHEGLWEGVGEKVLTGNATHFVPAVSEAPSACPVRRATHEKGAQVEEEELMEARTEDADLSILIRHFKGVAVETLKDLYDKCQQDVEWTTNLLLDSGEEMSREDKEGDETEDEDEFELQDECEGGEGDDEEEGTKREEMKGREGGEAEAVGIGIAESTREDTEPDVSGCDPADVKVSSRSGKASEGTYEDAEDHSQLRQESESQREQSAQEPTSQATMTSQSQEASQQEGTSESQSKTVIEHTGTGTRLLMDACAEQSEWAVGLQRGNDGQVERDEEKDARSRLEEVDAVTQSILNQLEELVKKEEDEKERDKREKERERRKEKTKASNPLDIQSLELRLPTELALQLTELFGPVGANPDTFSDDCYLKMDLNLARLLHQKWKETIQEKQRQAALSYHLLQESSVHWGESQTGMSRPHDRSKAHFLIGADGYASLGAESDYADDTPVMDYRTLGQPYVSLRDIMSEEQALQDIEKSRYRGWDPELKDGAAMLKEKQIFSLFPTIDRLFLKDIFRDYNFSLEQTEKFLHSLLDVGPVKNVVATDSAPQHNHSHTQRTPSKERLQTNKQKETELMFQDTDDPEYQDFRAEANLQRTKQQECFSKAAEAYRRDKKQVASFYAQQGHLHGQKMREANHRAALCIFERVNSSLLPQNVLDLHGLHVTEAIEHLQRILKEKSAEYKQGLCRPQLSVITGRGNRSQGGVARIRPAVIDYLNSKHYEFTEPNVGLVLVSLQKEAKA